MHGRKAVILRAFRILAYSCVSIRPGIGYNLSPGDQDLNYCNNVRIFRFAAALLNYAELVVIHGQTEVNGLSAQSCLDRIRKRAFGTDNSIPATAENIKLERRREFLGEGMRFGTLFVGETPLC
ncbi:MAG: RagB/SusD family nutrient uptake outer membrane protein [Bacteroides graminisolvens]